MSSIRKPLFAWQRILRLDTPRVATMYRRRTPNLLGNRNG